MGMHEIGYFMRLVEAIGSVDELALAMAEITAKLGFEFFALSHHVDVVNAGDKAIRLHNYPPAWADYYDANALGVTDPVHRASHLTSVGFCWSRIPNMVSLTPGDLRQLALGRERGIGDGYTVPANVPGEARGSCSFANRFGQPTDFDLLPLAQLAGAFAFEAARRLWSVRKSGDAPQPVLTDRQRDCLLWAARGKGDWEIGRILDVSQETVACHIKNACERYDVNRRSLLMIQTLYDGTITFFDVVRR